MRQPKSGTRRVPRWERTLLGALTYPGNIILGSVAVLVLSLGVITALPAAIALARAFASWTAQGDDKVFTNTFREFARTWRRTLGLGVVAVVVFGIMVADGLFLSFQLSQPGGSLALLFSAAVLPLSALACVYTVAITAAATLNTEANASTWIREAIVLMLGSPRRSLLVLLTVVVVVVTCVLLPTLAPFAAVAVPVYVGVRCWGPRPPVNTEQD
ncbi:DUF624 domain-containing protein [Salinibacterium sp. G-O1]|uniref:DUF624 domain-containing protein n=1 Tax=Salinibacterium sp. G-O1 TaxID=3046208 RepID=UPI0024B9588E|nr:DUF624 domain-containing protein [Salinibacterium sp. G-O1]MDJ0335341.1 DUF624 domain-containing protein [Salinibacterium sp. G-O1]